MKAKTSRNQVHTPKSPIGMGDYYGTGIKNPIGKMRDSYMDGPVKPNNKRKPPRSLA